MANFPNHQYHHQYIPAHLLQLAYQQKNSHHPVNPAPQAWMARYLAGGHDNRYRGNVGAQLGMVIPNVGIRQGIPGSRIDQHTQSARKRQRDSPGPYSAAGNNSYSHSGPKKQKESQQLQPKASSAPSTATKPSDNSHTYFDRNTPSTSSKPPLAPAELLIQSTLTVPGTSSPSLDNLIASAVEDELTSKDTPKSGSKTLQENLRKTPQRTPDPAKQVPNTTNSRQSQSSGKSTNLETNTDRLTPPTRNAVKRSADAASLAKSAPAAVKYSRRDTGGSKEEQNSATLLDTPTSSKQSNNQRRNSLPAAVKDTLADQILKRYEQTKQQAADLDRKEDMRIQLEKIIHEVMPYTMLFLVGSSRNCFGSRTSDADMCLMVTEGEMNQKRDAKNILYQLQRYLKDRCRFIRNLKVIPAKVPIIKFNHKYSGLECDLNVNNATGIRNTHLLQAYAKLDYRVAPLVLMVKQWAGHNDINDASQGTLSSYSLVLMVLNYLQAHCKPPVLPALQQRYTGNFHKFSEVRQFHDINPNSPLPSHIRYESQNKEDVGALFRGFFNYYANFDFSSKVMSVRTGKVLHVNQVASKTGGDWLNKYILIEEPFDLTNTARAVYSIDKFVIIKEEIRQVNRKFKHQIDGHVMKLSALCGRM